MSAAVTTRTLAEHVAAYLSHWRALGRRYRQEEWLLSTLARELPALGHDDLDAAAFDRWFGLRLDRHPNTRRKWAQIVRHFCRFRQRSEPECFVPPADRACLRQPYVTPVIVDDAQVVRLLNIAGRLEPSPNSPLRPATMRLAVILLYTTGMRLGELLDLTLEDVEDDGALLRIRESKFKKTRLLPLSPSAQGELQGFTALRAQVGFSGRPSSPLLCCGSCRRPRAYSMSGLQSAINRLFLEARVVGPTGRRPRVHDLRHSFAVQAVVRWYRRGADVQALLPRLAMYMGHVSMESTAYYLRWTPELALLASARFEERFADVLVGGRS